MKCPKCKGEMTQGALHTPHGMFSMTEIRFLQEDESKLSLTKRAGRKTKSFCCNECGYIETYLIKT